MPVFTKSVQAEPSKSDGIRICIMRRIGPHFELDMWIHHLCPSTELLKSYHDKEITWEEFEEKFTTSVLDNEEEKKYLELIKNLGEKETITLMCWEETPEKCHRRLVAQRLKKLYPSLEITIG